MNTSKFINLIEDKKFNEAYKLVEASTNVNEYNESRFTPLLYLTDAYISGEDEEPVRKILELLLKKGADPNLTEKAYPYYSALANVVVRSPKDQLNMSTSKLVELLLQYGADVNQLIRRLSNDPPLPNYRTILSIACGSTWRDVSKLIQFLIEKGAKVNPGKNDYSIEELKKYGIEGDEIKSIDKKKRNIHRNWEIEQPLQVVINSSSDPERSSKFNLLLSKGALFQMDFLEDLMSNSVSYVMTDIESLLEKGIDLSWEDQYGRSILDIAIERRRKELITFVKSKNLVPVREINPKELKKLDEAMQKQLHIAFQPIVEKGETEGNNNKFSGTPLLLKNESWPLCGCCSQPMVLLLQLDLDTLPNETKEIIDANGVLQVFHCQNVVDRDPCEVIDSAWEYKSKKSKLVRLISKKECSLSTKKVAIPNPLPVISIKSWKQINDFPTENEELKLNVANRKIYIQQEDDQYRNKEVNKLGGWPTWIQDIEYPKCKQCKKKMKMLFQLVSDVDHGWGIGDMGVAYLMQCENHKEELAFGSQSS